MDSEKRTEKMHDLDLSYQQISHQAELTIKAEEARRLKLRGLLLRDENAAFKDNLACKEEDIKKLSAQRDAIKKRLQTTTEQTLRQEKEMASQARELANLKEQINSLTAISQDAAKLLSEKLTLARQINILRPEMEYLKEELAHQNDILAEKLALTGKLNKLELELANAKTQSGHEADLHKELQDLEKQIVEERRISRKLREDKARVGEMEVQLEELRLQLAAAKEKLLDAERQRIADMSAAKAKAKGPDNADAVAEELEQLRLELAETKKELANEKKDKERIRKEAKKALAEAESLRLPLEERIVNLKSKLRETREQLKECRADLERAQEAAIAAATTTKVPTKTAATAKAAPAGKKRRANEISAPEASVLQTPGKDDDRPKRTFKKPFAPAAVGEKSTFSITPFLNKTINLSDPSLHPIAEDEPEEQDDQATPAEPSAQSASPTHAVVKKKQPMTKRSKAKAALTESSPSKHNTLAGTKSQKAPSAESTLDKVTEEAEEEAADQENQAAAAPPAPKQRKKMVLKNRTAPSATTASAATAATSKLTALSAPSATAPAPAAAEPKKKKRKLVGGPSTSVLFDGAADADDASAPAAPVAAAAAPAPAKRVVMGKVALGGGGGGAGLAAKRAVGLGVGLGAKNAFAGASFSPLKRDRRGVGASFLA